LQSFRMVTLARFQSGRRASCPQANRGIGYRAVRSCSGPRLCALGPNHAFNRTRRYML
jgi:hypothetical protein